MPPVRDRTKYGNVGASLRRRVVVVALGAPCPPPLLTAIVSHSAEFWQDRAPRDFASNSHHQMARTAAVGAGGRFLRQGRAGSPVALDTPMTGITAKVLSDDGTCAGASAEPASRQPGYEPHSGLEVPRPSVYFSTAGLRCQATPGLP